MQTIFYKHLQELKYRFYYFIYSFLTSFSLALYNYDKSIYLWIKPITSENFQKYFTFVINSYLEIIQLLIFNAFNIAIIFCIPLIYYNIYQYYFLKKNNIILYYFLIYFYYYIYIYFFFKYAIPYIYTYFSKFEIASNFFKNFHIDFYPKITKNIFTSIKIFFILYILLSCNLIIIFFLDFLFKYKKLYIIRPKIYLFYLIISLISLSNFDILLYITLILLLIFSFEIFIFINNIYYNIISKDFLN